MYHQHLEQCVKALEHSYNLGVQLGVQSHDSCSCLPDLVNRLKKVAKPNLCSFYMADIVDEVEDKLKNIVALKVEEQECSIIVMTASAKAIIGLIRSYKRQPVEF